MSNKFLGLDSINVIKQYIDDTVANNVGDTRILTIQAYTYVLNTDPAPVTPMGGGFDVNGIVAVYPNGGYYPADGLWTALHTLIDGNDHREGLIDIYGSIDAALAVGSIWMSAGVIDGNSAPVWSTPMKISGQNGSDGTSVQFRWTNDAALTVDDIDNMSTVAISPSADHRNVYVWTSNDNINWSRSLWAVYSEDASNVLWRYCTTQTLDIPNRPSIGDSLWSNNIITNNLSEDYPYMWMSFQIVPAGASANDSAWSEPILFGHWGADGAAGADGNVPDYTYTLYHMGYSDPEISSITGIIAPEKPEFVEDATITDYIKDGWVELPEDMYADLEVPEGETVPVDASIWWQCTFMVDGKTNKVLSSDSIGAVKRYNAVDGTAKAGQFTINLYAWSETQAQPEMSDTLIDEWRPSNYEYLPDRPTDLTSAEASLWMITANVDGLDEKGVPVVNGSWSEPVKLTGPRGPIGYDYRNETRYMNGTADAPRALPTDEEWSKTIPTTDSTYPYIWAKNYLVCYKMEYGELDEATNEHKIVPTGQSEIIEEYDIFRLTGTNGADGNRKNSLNYNVDAETVSVKSFAATNLYVLNGDADVTYNIELDKLAFVNGYTGKFANISAAGNMIINAGDFTLLGSGKTAKSITIVPNETVELVCYNNDGVQSLLVIGKPLE